MTTFMSFRCHHPSECASGLGRSEPGGPAELGGPVEPPPLEVWTEVGINLGRDEPDYFLYPQVRDVEAFIDLFESYAEL